MRQVVGDRTIPPDEDDKLQITRAGDVKIVGSFRLCIDEQGVPAEISIVRTTGLPRYDARIITHMGDWRYRPYRVDDKPVKVCTAVTFIYQQSS